MKLATFSTANDTRRRIGLVKGDGVVDLTRYLDAPGLTLLELIQRWGESKNRIAAADAEPAPVLKLADVRLHAPMERPGKIAAIGLNYLDHIEESGLERPKQQLWFSKATSSVNGPYDPIDIPKASEAVDYEAELVAVIGKRTRHASLETARDAIFGYCVGNDVSVRDWQTHTPQWFLGKSFDTHAPYGPWIVTSAEVGDPHDLGIRCFVNGDRRQNSNTRHLVFNVFEQVMHLSRAMTLEPGDLIFTGTPGGVGLARNPKVWLKAGDTVRVEIDRIGAIEAVMEPEKLSLEIGILSKT